MIASIAEKRRVMDGFVLVMRSGRDSPKHQIYATLDTAKNCNNGIGYETTNLSGWWFTIHSKLPANGQQINLLIEATVSILEMVAFFIPKIMPWWA